MTCTTAPSSAWSPCSSPCSWRARRSGSTRRARRLLDDAVGQAQAAIDELRELAAGLHPPVLAYRGLVAAVEELAARALLPVIVTGSLPGRLAEAVETNAYFFVAEALTNTVKHARAARAEVRIGVDDRTLSVEVRDDGIGGAVVDGSGSGLAGLADRVGALGGRMDSRPPRDAVPRCGPRSRSAR